MCGVLSFNLDCTCTGCTGTADTRAIDVHSHTHTHTHTHTHIHAYTHTRAPVCRHNFSIYYYSIYLSYEDRDGSTSSHGMVELPSVHDVLQTFSAIARKPVAELLGIGLDLMPQISW